MTKVADVTRCLTAVVVGLSATALAKSQPSRPNIILMMADDLGWGDPSFMGNKDVRTPHLDAMASAGLRFNRFYAGAPVCSPTRGSCLTGRHPFRYGVVYANEGRMRAKELTLAELLQKCGYTTGHFGKWHLGTLTKPRKGADRGDARNPDRYSVPWDNGFDVCFSTEKKVPTWNPMIRPRKNTGQGKTWWDLVTDPSHALPYGGWYWSNGKKVTDNIRGDDSRIIMDRAIPFIRGAARSGKPFLAVIWFHAPHVPVVAGPRYTKMYSQFGKHKQHYLGCITAMDEQIGRLRKELRDLGMADNTMVWFCSDNGPEVGGKSPGSAGFLRGRKGSLFEGGVRVPGLLEWPAKVKAGSVADVPASTSDYLPTVLDVLGVKMPDDRPIDGISLLPMIEGRMEQRPRPIGFESMTQTALIDNRYKIIRLLLPTDNLLLPRDTSQSADKKNNLAPPFMLFDLVEDPSEKRDIAGKHPEIVKRMVATLEAWRMSCRDSLAGKDYR